MPKYLELSAHVKLNSSSAGEVANQLMSKKMIPLVENGEHQGYVVTSPATGRNVIIGNEIKFNGDFILPTFARSVCVPEDADAGMPAEEFIILNGMVGYIENQEFIGCMPMIDCTWEPEEGGTGRCT